MDHLDKPTLNDSFPNSNDNLKINKDLNNQKHGPHYDVITPIRGGVDQARIKPNGDIKGGTTRIGKTKADW